MTDTTMTTKLRQAEAALLALAAELDVPAGTAYDTLYIGVYDNKFTVSITQLSGNRYASGKTLEEAYLKLANIDVPF